MPKETTEASLKNIYKDDKSRVPIIKYFKEFFDNYENSFSFVLGILPIILLK